jgi:predicted nucleic acid-binding protein
MPTPAVSDFAQAEFASAVSRRVRTGELTVEEAREAFSALDVWTARAVRRITTSSADVAATTVFLRRLDLTLRTADALNIAIAERTGCALLTFDRKMAENAQAIGLSIAAG